MNTSAVSLRSTGNRERNIDALVAQLVMELGKGVGELHGRLTLAADANFVTNGDLTIAAAAFYHKTRIDVGNTDEADHVSAELDFMTMNVGLASIAVQGDSDARAKLAEYLATQPAAEQVNNGSDTLRFAWNETGHPDAAKVIARGDTGIPVPDGPVICVFPPYTDGT